jgi:hypothetical protein
MKLTRAVGEIQGHQKAPAEILERGPDGRASKIKKGSVTYRVEYQGDKARMIPL